jgi:hypothetical protein
MSPDYIEERIVKLREKYEADPTKARAAFYFAELHRYFMEFRFGDEYELLFNKLMRERDFYLDEIEK